jgi:hypothetical protein
LGIWLRPSVVPQARHDAASAGNLPTMADNAGPSEFGGKPMRNTLMPPKTPIGDPGHTNLEAYEKLRLMYRAGVNVDEGAPSTSDYRPDAWEGLDPPLPKAKPRISRVGW